MEIFIALAILALIVRIALVFLCPNVDNFLSGHDGDTGDYCQRGADEPPPYHATVGGWSSGGTIVNNSTNNYGISVDD